MNAKVGGFAPDLGLEYIGRYDPHAADFPAQRETQLTGAQLRQRVDELFRSGSLDQVLRQFASPCVNDPALLTPVRFEQLVRDSARTLETMAQQAERPALRAAGALLAQELELRDLLASYRRLLMPA